MLEPFLKISDLFTRTVVHMTLSPETPNADVLNRMVKYNLFNELKKNKDRNSKLALSDKKVKAHLAKLRAHFAATGGGNGDQQLAEIMHDMHPTVQGVYHLMQGQTTTIVAAIDGRADAIDAKLDDQSVKLDQQMRVMRGQLLPEDSIGLTDQELLAQNCQSVRSMQSQNIQLRARIKGVVVPCDLEERTKRLEDLEAAKAAKMADNEMRKTNIAQKKLDMSQKKADKEKVAAEKKANKTPTIRRRVSKTIKVEKTDPDIKMYFYKPGEKQDDCEMEGATPAFATEVEEEVEPDGLDVN